ncbi:MAG: helicase RepA family protein, partial [Gemmataceae bacterium]|nr:helicase RepA family protein [Gemmataceae bacterium]
GVLYLALEGQSGIANRVAAFKEFRRANAADLPFQVVPVAVDLLSPDGDVLRVIEAARDAAAEMGVPVGLVVVDTLSRAIAGGNENSSEDMGALVRHIDLIRQALPAHVLIVHHSGKDGARGARGHSLLRAATDLEIEIAREFGTRTSVARVTKHKELEAGDEFAFDLLPVELGVNRRGKPVTSCVVRHVDDEDRPSAEDVARQKDMLKKVKERQRDAADDQEVLRVLDAEVGRGQPGCSISRIEDAAKCSKERVRESVRRLVERGVIEEFGPFEVPSGHGAKTRIKTGYRRPPVGGLAAA